MTRKKSSIPKKETNYYSVDKRSQGVTSRTNNESKNHQTGSKEKRWLTAKKTAIGLLVLGFLTAAGATLAPRSGADPADWEKKRLGLCETQPENIAKSACYAEAFVEILTRLASEGKLQGKIYISISIKDGNTSIFESRAKEINLSLTPLNLTPLTQVLTALKAIDVKNKRMSVYMTAVQARPYTYGVMKLYNESYTAVFLPHLKVDSDSGSGLIYNAISSSCSIRKPEFGERHYLMDIKLASNIPSYDPKEGITVASNYSRGPYERYTYPANGNHIPDLIECANLATPLFQGKYISLTKSQSAK